MQRVAATVAAAAILILSIHRQQLAMTSSLSLTTTTSDDDDNYFVDIAESELAPMDDGVAAAAAAAAPTATTLDQSSSTAVTPDLVKTYGQLHKIASLELGTKLLRPGCAILVCHSAGPGDFIGSGSNRQWHCSSFYRPRSKPQASGCSWGSNQVNNFSCALLVACKLTDIIVVWSTSLAC